VAWRLPSFFQLDGCGLGDLDLGRFGLSTPEGDGALLKGGAFTFYLTVEAT